MGDLSPNFSRWEFACKCGCGLDSIDSETLIYLEMLRQHFRGRRVTITSAHRCEKYNREVGGGEDSEHLRARAVDFVVQGVAPREVQDYLEKQFPDEFGIGRYDDFTHFDTRRTKARWNG